MELLVTITILAILGSAVLFASLSANQAARVAATRAKVAALHSLVMEKYDEFETRRVDVEIPQSAAKGALQWRAANAIRLVALRMLMRMEMPDRWSDVVFDTVENRPPTQTGNLSSYPSVLPLPGASVPPLSRTSLSLAYLRRYDSLKTTDPRIIQANEGAECLYMLVTLATGDGEALGFFRDSDIGDVDGDGAPEFLDAWGRPIHFLQAPPGFTQYSDLQSGDPVKDHDPFDHYRIDEGAYRLVPLIYSAGPDGDPDLATLKSAPMAVHPLAERPMQPLVYYQPPMVLLGAPLAGDVDSQVNEENDGENWHDNIHNHEMNVRQ